MKRMKRLLSLGIALVMAFGALSVGMVVHADEGANPADSTVAFASLSVGGKSINVIEGTEEYSVTGYDKTSAEVSWTLNEGWNVSYTSYYTSGDNTIKELKNGGTVKVPKGGNAEVSISADNGYYYRNYRIGIYNGKTKLLGGTLWLGAGEAMPVCEGISNNSEVVSIKSSKPDVLKAGKGDRLYSCVLLPKKAGSSKVTVVVKVNGKEKKLSATYTVKKYPKAITSLKVNGKKVDLKKYKFMASQKVKKDKSKLEFKLAKGWKLKSCSYYDEAKGKVVKVKSGGTVNTKSAAWVVFTLTKGSDTFYYELSLER